MKVYKGLCSLGGLEEREPRPHVKIPVLEKALISTLTFLRLEECIINVSAEVKENSLTA